MRNKLLTVLGTGFTTLILCGSTAFACTYGITGTGACQTDGSYKITWTVNNTDTAVNQPMTITSSSNASVVPVGTIIAADKSASFTQTASGTKPANFTLDLVGNWPSHQLNETQSGSVDLSQACTQPAPIYSCGTLGIQSEDNNTVKLTGLSTTAQNGAVFSNAVINWGDSTTPLTTSNIANQTHQYANSGTYTITATANFTVNGQNISTTSQSCSQVVTFAAPIAPSTPTPTPPQPTPTTLVNTGPGNIIASALATTIGGALAFNWFERRKLNKTV
jgi:hypothetical protein